MEGGSRPSFAVVIPAYEAAATIGEALESVRAQTLAPAEVLVCDDGSADDLEGALEPFQGFARLLRGDHRGVSAARNQLLRAATADFVVPLDADDVYAPTRLQRLAELAEENPELDILGTDAAFVSGGREAGRFGERTPFAAERQAEAILDRCFLICPAMRRTRLLEIGGYDESLRTAEDWDVCIRLILSGSEAGLVDEPLLEYRLGGESLTARRSETLRERVYMLEKAAATPGLDPATREAAGRALSRHRARALEQAAIEAVEEGDPEARRRLRAVARSADVARRARLGAAIGSLAPARLGRVAAATLSGSTGRPRA
ncbi:MAG TPA: glycosyltransferase family A protein [Solirubrobacterales bacterium]|nr:glycosyltransferase family A protein [Solirubrobacterales bacterium]